MRLKVCHLYPDLLNLYGDQGNVLIFCRRAAWRGIKVELDSVSLHDRVRFTHYDFIFLGGGADLEQGLVSKDLEKKGPLLIEAAEAGVVILSICGGYQLLGRSYKTQGGAVLPGVGLFDIHTGAGRKRLKGNILLELAPELQTEVNLCCGRRNSCGSRNENRRGSESGSRTGGRHEVRPGKQHEARPGNRNAAGALTTLVGFENHSGRTFLGSSVRPLGRVLKGNGNNGEDRTEGVWYKNAFGTYLHGPFLSKNPHFADLLLARALSRRWGPQQLLPLDDTLELHAHNVMKKRLQKGCRR